MVSREELIDIVAEEIESCCSAKKILNAPQKGETVPKWKKGFFLTHPFNPSFTTLKTKRRFFSEWEIKRLLGKDQKILKLPPNSIVSPLAHDWLELKGIQVIFEP